jgi:hypothetical protein
MLSISPCGTVDILYKKMIIFNIINKYSIRIIIKMARNVQLFCDLDGVLADFDEGTKSLLGKYPDELNQRLMWSTLKKYKTFYEDLQWMPEGKILWENIKKYNPIILTGCPHGYPSAVKQKLNWCARELGPDVKVITCKTKDKPKFCNPNSGDILIDDRTIIMDEWIAKGGKYILYSEGNLESILEGLDNI